jgi:surfactin synthase thioesterase subunit
MTTAGITGKWLLRTPSAVSRERLFCFPYSGAGASMYNQWPRYAGSTEICPLQLPGRENRMREPLFTTYEELATGVADGLMNYLDRPFGFFGHCGGALAAFATARHLERSCAVSPSCLFISSQVAPHEGPFGRFLTMTADQLRTELTSLTIALGGQPTEAGTDLSLSVLQSDISANRRYRLATPEPLQSHLYAIGWAEDAEVPHALMAGWSAYSAADSFYRVVLDGQHYSFLRGPIALMDIFRRGFARAERARRRTT